MKPRIEVYQTMITRKWRWRLLGANGEPMTTSEPYPSKRNAQRGAEDAYAAFGEAHRRRPWA